ncbi:HPr(Ser) kinase/phosphatase [Pelagicoccus sp. NFK12]|uniref:HPr kinase/phosphorylase n=1 Tax=Pelagicoccus enzymogenes TaxID=2773457 RepID=A0A927IFP8_9BACT|nr:HPr(Ser) kinase/phosphatase [Pelagicoccus enzymogenes]MBD5778019.1 HPr(Ser) kinase/phosphatase [Pelagicoccus enzymogenes]MDQ8197925.1 HPr(Ser) kinase/phosphatase [Pelagicoccus enzymogenes]
MPLPKPVKRIDGLSVRDFLDKHQELLKLEVVAGKRGLRRIIKEGSVNRPSLALTGFYKYFANKRLQVIGAAEMTYLRSLPTEVVHERFNTMISKGIPCLIIARNYNPLPVMLELAEKRSLPILRTSMITMNFLNAATLAVDGEFAPTTTEHGTMMDIKGIGTLIRGSSGVGKSECALALIERGHSIVADDMTRIKLIDERELTASSMELNRGHMECRGIGIINVGEMFGVRSVRLEKRIDLVISLVEANSETEEDRTGLEQQYYPILGIDVPHVELFVRPGRDMARLVEVAAMVQALKLLGHDPAKEFNDRLIAFMARNA